MSINYKYRMLSGLESAGGANIVWAEVAAAADLASVAGSVGSIATIVGDPDKFYIYDGSAWGLLDKPDLDLFLGGIDPITLLVVNKLLAVPLSRLTAVELYSVLTTRGDIVYRAAAAPARLPKGNSGEVLTQGANDPAWAVPSALAANVSVADAGGFLTAAQVEAALQEIARIYQQPLASAATEEAKLWAGLAYFDTGTRSFKVCTTKGEQELDSVTVTKGAESAAGNIAVTLNGVSKNVAVLTGVAEVRNATITHAATAAGDITITLNGVAKAVTVANEESAIAVAGKITTAFADHAVWTVGNVDAVLTFTAKADGAMAGAFTFAAGETGVTCTAGITQTTPGVTEDDAEGVAKKIRDATYTGWTTGGTGTTVTFTKDAVGACSAPSISANATGATFGDFSRTNQGVTTVWIDTGAIKTSLAAAEANVTLLQAILLGFKGTASAAPASGTFAVNDKYFNSEPAAEEYIGWVCTALGTMGTLNSSSTTGSILTATEALTVSALTGLLVGQYIDVATVTGPLKIESIPAALGSTTVDVESALGQKVLSVAATTNFAAGETVCIGFAANCEVGVIDSIQAGVSLTLVEDMTKTHAISETVTNCVVVDTAADATATAQAVSFHAATWKGFGMIEGA